jgi:hypothetical protein
MLRLSFLCTTSSVTKIVGTVVIVDVASGFEESSTKVRLAISIR